MESWEIYDENRVLTGKTMLRGADFGKGDYHMVIHVCLFNKKGEMLIQQRQPFKESWSDMWDVTVGGSAISGDCSSTAAERELFEEIGYRVDFSRLRPQFTVNYECGFDDYYLIEEEPDIHTLTMQYEEVQRVKWASEEEIKDMIRAGLFIPYYEDLIALCFAMKGKCGSHVV